MASAKTNQHFDDQLKQKAQFVNELLKNLLAEQDQINEDLKKALVYTLEGKGKRIRSALTLWSCELVAGRANRSAEIAAAAIEMVHTYSLVHDDLPAMDNDDLRRGRPTCHKAFDEATALLAGDGLLTLAFEILATKVDDPKIAVNLIRQLALAAGPAGMIAGQMADLNAENTQGSVELLEYIHINKTAKMFSCAAAAGAIAGEADIDQLNSLSDYGMKIGLCFQIADDILDVCASTEQLGKTAGKDAKAAKCTYPEIIGIEKSKIMAKNLTETAITTLAHFGPRADILRELAETLLERSK